LQAKGCNGPKQTRKGKRVIQQAEQLWAKVSGDPYAHQQTNSQAQNLVEKQPSNVVNYFDQVLSVFDSPPDKSWHHPNDYGVLF